MRLAHISDLHFGSFSLNPLQFFSKRWIGNFNFLLTRKKHFSHHRLTDLVDLFKELRISHVVITGDCTVTARTVEYKRARRFVELLQKEGVKVFTIPGNHDHYTRLSYKRQKFYKFFPKSFDSHCPLNLRDDRVTYTKIGDKLWIVALDTTLSTQLLSAQGRFDETLKENLEKAIGTIPSDEKILLLNHYPIFHIKAGRHELIGASLLENLLKKHLNVELYLHGHTHRQTVADLRESDLPIISDSGSTPHAKNGACHLFEIVDNAIKLDVYEYDKEWRRTNTHEFTR